MGELASERASLALSAQPNPTHHHPDPRLYPGSYLSTRPYRPADFAAITSLAPSPRAPPRATTRHHPRSRVLACYRPCTQAYPPSLLSNLRKPRSYSDPGASPSPSEDHLPPRLDRTAAAAWPEAWPESIDEGRVEAHAARHAAVSSPPALTKSAKRPRSPFPYSSEGHSDDDKADMQPPAALPSPSRDASYSAWCVLRPSFEFVVRPSPPIAPVPPPPRPPPVPHARR